MILIVDDKEENLFSLKSLLQLNLYEVDTAISGEDALKKILKKEYVLIILDVQMPGMDGYEVAEIITGSSKAKNIPIIFLSAVNIDKRFITKGYAAGGVDYVTKPFEPDLLLLKIKTFYRLYEQTRELDTMQVALKAEIEIRKEAQKELQETNQLLEDKVRERTKELLRMNKELELNNIELQQYASIASHDLQEPLRKIIIFSRIIEESYLADLPAAEQYMRKIISSAERMRNLIDDLLNYSKLSASSQFTLTSLNNILQGTLTDLELSVKEKNAQLIIKSLPDIEVIAAQIRQVFQNIISNALKFSKKEGTPRIEIWGELIAEKSVDAPVKQNGNYLRICIQDNGIGFNEIYIDKIFTIFQRLHTKEEYDGTGIGLAIVKKIVEKHNGLFSAKSKENEGSAFIVILPVRQNRTPVQLPDKPK